MVEPLLRKQIAFEEWTRLIDKVLEDTVAVRAEDLFKINYSIHFYVWAQVEFFELILYLKKKIFFSIEIKLLQKDHILIYWCFT